MVAGLSGALAQCHEVTVVTSLYRGIREQFPEIGAFGDEFDLSLGDASFTGRWWRHQPSPNLTVLLLENDAFFDRPGLYMEHGEGYSDNPERFIFLSKAVHAGEGDELGHRPRNFAFVLLHQRAQK